MYRRCGSRPGWSGWDRRVENQRKLITNTLAVQVPGMANDGRAIIHEPAHCPGCLKLSCEEATCPKVVDEAICTLPWLFGAQLRDRRKLAGLDATSKPTSRRLLYAYTAGSTGNVHFNFGAGGGIALRNPRIALLNKAQIIHSYTSNKGRGRNGNSQSC